MYHLTKYLLNEQENIFREVDFDLKGKRNLQILREYSTGLNSNEEIEEKRYLFGNNELNIKAKSTFDILIDEILNPFNLFQVENLFVVFFKNLLDFFSCSLV